MRSDIYHNPTKIYFGTEWEPQISNMVATMVAPNPNPMVLLVYGSDRIKKSGLYDRITGYFERFGVTYIPFGGVQPDPIAEHAEKGISLGKAFGANAVVGIGGGSVIDTAKAIAMGIPYRHTLKDLFFNNILITECLPIGVLVTLAGSGSESSNSSVITFGKEKIPKSDKLLFPTWAILNPAYTITVPPRETAIGILDAIVHVLERYVTGTGDTMLSDGLCESVMRSLMYNAPLIMKKPTDYDIRAELMWACKLAHDPTIGFGRHQDWSSHKIAHILHGYATQVPHGLLVGIIAAAWLAQIGWHRTLDSRKLISFMKKLDLPTNLEALEIQKQYFKDISIRAVQDMPSGSIGNYVHLYPNKIEELLEIAYVQ